VAALRGRGGNVRGETQRANARIPLLPSRHPSYVGKVDSIMEDWTISTERK